MCPQKTQVWQMKIIQITVKGITVTGICFTYITVTSIIVTGKTFTGIIVTGITALKYYKIVANIQIYRSQTLTLQLLQIRFR